MKKLGLLMAVIMAAGVAQAGNGLGLYGTYWSPADLDNAFGGGAKLQFSVAPNLTLEARAGFFPKLEDDFEGITFETMAVPVEGALTLSFPLDAITLFAGGGAGYYIFPDGKLKGGGEEIDFEFQSEFGFFAMGGAQFKMNEQVALFGAVKYLWLEIDEVEVDGEKIDLGGDEIDLGGVMVDVGLLMQF
ncbi:MAG: porin family protein [Candidatus Marinimicrobia bacterium]|nr:porin family protein [Candidatus Neomarinimicrobiota bacterium]